MNEQQTPATPATTSESAPVSANLELVCPQCGQEMMPEHAHSRCPICGYRDTCCEGAPL